MSMHVSEVGVILWTCIFSPGRNDFPVSDTILQASVDFQYLRAVVNVLSAWKLWRFEFEKRAGRLLSPDNIVWGFGGVDVFPYISIPTQEIKLSPKEIGLSLHNVMGTNTLACTQIHTCAHSSSCFALFCCLSFTRTNRSFGNVVVVEFSIWLSFFATQVLAKSFVT